MTDDSTNNATSLILNQELHQSEFIIMAGRDITAKTIENTSYTKPMLIKGRKLFNDAKGSLTNIRKALAVLKQLDEVSFIDGEIQYKSGVSEDEVKIKVLDGMYAVLKGKTVVEETEEETGAETEMVEQEAVPTRPPGWFFQGWMAFVVFGPFANAKDRLNLLEIGHHPDDSKKNIQERHFVTKTQS
jgi:hypothetical protein